MRWIYGVARWWLGIIFVTASINAMWMYVLKQDSFLPINEQATGMIVDTQYLYVLVKICEAAGAVMLLTNRYLGLGSLLLAPVVVNIFMMHLIWDPSFLPAAFTMIVAEAVLLWRCRGLYAPLLTKRIPSYNY
jgi:putative oxidoreductase